jgi:hypothetical protein
LLKTKRQKVDHVEFSSTGGLLAQGDEEVVCWEHPTAGDLSFRVPTRFTWGAAFSGTENWFAVSNSHGVSFFRPSDGHREKLAGVRNWSYMITSGQGRRILLRQAGVSLIAVTLSSGGEPRQL